MEGGELEKGAFCYWKASSTSRYYFTCFCQDQSFSITPPVKKTLLSFWKHNLFWNTCFVRIKVKKQTNLLPFSTRKPYKKHFCAVQTPTSSLHFYAPQTAYIVRTAYSSKSKLIKYGSHPWVQNFSLHRRAAFFSASLVHTLNIHFYICYIQKRMGNYMIGISFIPEYKSLKWSN